MALPLAPDEHGVLRTDWSPLLPLLMDESRAVGERAAAFHASLARALVAQAERVRAEQGTFAVGLTGGVFQNRRLAETALRLLADAGFDARLGEQIPANDAGISFGQVIEAAVHTRMD